MCSVPKYAQDIPILQLTQQGKLSHISTLLEKLSLKVKHSCSEHSYSYMLFPFQLDVEALNLSSQLFIG